MRLIDADALKQTFCAECDHSIKCEDCDIDYHFEHLAPTVDAVEVVRCKDCVNCSECITDDGMYIYIRCLRNGATIYEDDFCSWGERRGEQDE